MWLRVTSELEMNLTVASPMLLLLRPRSDAYQWVATDRYRVSPDIHVAEYTDRHGNLCQRLMAPAGHFAVHVSADVRIRPEDIDVTDAPFVPVERLPDEVLVYLLPSRFCEADRLGARAWEIVGGRRPGHEQVTAISRWIHARIDYCPDTDPAPIAASEVLARGSGVCRDLAHLGIALCRSLSIPARLAVGYVHGLEPMDLHAWFEAFVGGRWHTFDPTQANPGTGRVRLAYGRDATDVPLYHLFGPPAIPTRMEVDVQLMTDPGPVHAGPAAPPPENS
ncbi:transglutaminase family protein [Thioalkalivibrio sp. ALJ24]|uniref:transglutaminase domain-containing protein n=1 Tax=Thioalkalivibrio sp. ALJ24 TaxID=545276 RepID=UPI000379CBE7|nr:transglutaminase family protein [Thioalkalivibrio sp. ALJ24]